jgi:hypothetical protein
MATIYIISGQAKGNFYTDSLITKGKRKTAVTIGYLSKA